MSVTPPMTPGVGPYDYPVITVREVIDGDTVDLTLERDVGFGIVTVIRQRFRLAVIQTPEDSDGAEATAFAQRWFSEHRELRCTTYKPGGFGRFLADVYYTKEARPGVPASLYTLSQALLDAGLAVYYKRRR